MVSLDFFWLRGIFVNYTKFVIRIWWWSISWTWDAERNPLNSEVLRSPSLHRGHGKRAQRKDMKTPRRIRKYFVKIWEILEFLVGNFGHHAGGFEKSLMIFSFLFLGRWFLVWEYFSDGLTSIGKEDASNDASTWTKIGSPFFVGTCCWWFRTPAMLPTWDGV